MLTTTVPFEQLMLIALRLNTVEAALVNGVCRGCARAAVAFVHRCRDDKYYRKRLKWLGTTPSVPANAGGRCVHASRAR